MGGGVVRTVAKAAAFGAYRTARAPSVDQAAALREPAKAPAEGGDGPVQRVAWEGDEWVFARREGEEPFEGMHSQAPRRMVTGAVPTLEEAKEATNDLKDAVEKIYLSPSATGFRRSAIESRSTSLRSHCLASMDADKGCAAILPSANMHVIQAFSWLQQSPEAQNVVASLASDEDVWNAVMKNEKVMKFYQTPHIDAPATKAGEHSDKSMNGDGKNTSNPAPEGSEGGLKDYMHTIKLKVKEMVNSLSELFDSFMGASTAAGSSVATSTATVDRSTVDAAPAASLVALAIATILLVLWKRGSPSCNTPVAT